jgi:hypothetical protein
MLCLCRKQVSEQAHERVISGFRRYVDEICTLLGYYAAYSGNSKVKVKGFLYVLNLEDRTDKLSPDVGKALQIYTV